MEVAGQWRREWAGAAEYGKVTEGGVTRQVARALEVLNASAPGARVRVMRAAWHSSAGPGLPSSSYMVHSSRQVIASGSRLLTSPSLILSKPLEISSTPLEVSPDDDTENYKVTEPDDFDISEPSKWKTSTRRPSFRMPSEESSSTDNASIIDLDSKNNSLRRSNGWRRHSYDSENSDTNKSTSRTSPLLEQPVALSTLKFKSLLNNTNDTWHNRRKSYSFENKSPTNETFQNSNETLAMESSTDSGICKSTEIVNEEDNSGQDDMLNRNTQSREETFKDWLARNRPNKLYKNIEVKTHNEYQNIEEQRDSRGTLQSVGEVSISLPNKHSHLNRKSYDDDLKRTKRVEFCKTELHFAAESGKVNIIATDEKPPPSNDFRKRRSAFVPIKGNFDKSVTLFGEKFDDLLVINGQNVPVNEIDNVAEEENTAATKGILKNKIPKPKPYLLGENMEIGKRDSSHKTLESISQTTATALINKQLKMESRINQETPFVMLNDNNTASKEITHKVVRTLNTGLTDIEYGTQLGIEGREIKVEVDKTDNDVRESDQTSFRRTLKILQSSPILQARSKTRQLKESDLTYFGIGNKEINVNKIYKTYRNNELEAADDTFNAVRLVQRASNDVLKVNKTSQEDYFSEYQNIPIKLDFTPVPTPRLRIKTDQLSNHVHMTNYDRDNTTDEEIIKDTHRSRSKKYDDVIYKKPRSHSEPPKYRHFDYVRSQSEKASQQPSLKTNKQQAIVSIDISVKSEGEMSEKVIKKNDKFTEKISNIEGTSGIGPSKNIRQVYNKVPLYENIDIRNKTVKKTLINKNKAEDRKDTDKQQRKSRSQHSNGDEQNKFDQTHSDSSTNKTTISDNKKGSSGNKHSPHSNIGINYSGRAIKEQTKHDEKEKDTNDKISKKVKSNSTTTRDVVDKCEGHTLLKENKLKISNNNKNDIDQNSKRRYRNKRDTSESKKEKPLPTLDNHKPEMHFSKAYKNRTKSKDAKGNSENDIDIKLDKRCRREYILNYDDKNGTFASISKLRHGSSPDKIKPNISKKKYSSEFTSKTPTKTTDKQSLLQSRDLRRIQYGLNSEDRKWKSKVYRKCVERSCRIL